MDPIFVYGGFLAALFLSVILTVIFAVLIGRRGPWGSAWTLFLVLFLALWTVSIYVSPVGPVYWGVAWVPLTFAGILLITLLFAIMPGASEKERSIQKDTSIPDSTKAAVGSFFWILVILFIVAIILGMADPQRVV